MHRLAETVEIDSRTRWRDAVELLQHDSRFKAVEDPRDREELFNDFVLELEKKEREDRLRKREVATIKINEILESKVADGSLTRETMWADLSSELVLLVSKNSELRILDDSDVKKCFQGMWSTVSFISLLYHSFH